ncbi:hypothetical protein [Flavobacterium glaciei]|uniref:Uncharacterized protein n=1 Tax=Flavobacterium glaciei TaxID=386300 RepID=A0A562PYB6_9FLAO|nr:hypothetical protein [Flavobacterium glaciei]RDI56506.1 hypothetical protein DFR66_10468 [Flavobacterium glaciei]TWI49076.1 hypothetical protein IQ02_01061 [Flavobacterium glaciei]
MEEFQTIAIFNYSHEIVVIKHLLEQEEINYFLKTKRWFQSILLAVSHTVESNSKFITTILKKFKNC